MNLIRITLPETHYHRERLYSTITDVPHSLCDGCLFYLKEEYHDFLIQNSPNSFYSLYAQKITASSFFDFDGFGLSKIPITRYKLELYTYQDTALLYKMSLL